jgi:hypothetical protein
MASSGPMTFVVAEVEVAAAEVVVVAVAVVAVAVIAAVVLPVVAFASDSMVNEWGLVWIQSY